MYKVMNNPTMEIPSQTKISIPWIYRLCRHPMQSGILMAIIFSSSDYHLGRIFLVSLFTLGVWLGIHQEERLLSREEDYRKYKLQVKNKLVPDIIKIIKYESIK
jgi:protein-S-isoprenylcysteine O-methyltransferase Ste14